VDGSITLDLDQIETFRTIENLQRNLEANIFRIEANKIMRHEMPDMYVVLVSQLHFVK
jgi:hypothetical protein